MKEKIKNYLLGILTSLCILFSVLFGVRSCQSSQPEIITKTDTVTIVRYDTVREQKIVNQVKYKYDTIVRYDTITQKEIVYIKDEPQHYIDSTSNYRIDINAVKLYDYDLQLYNKNTINNITKVDEIKKSKGFGSFCGVGVEIGAGGFYNPFDKSLGLGPYVGVGFVLGWGYHW